MAVSLGTIFVLNSVALLIFPLIGAALKLSQTQFGLWAALAIHDTSSVVGAAAKYGSAALQVGTTVKLARALWIVPLALGTALLKKRQSQNSMALVHCFLLSGGGVQHVCPGGCAVICVPEPTGEDRSYRHPVSDRQRDLARDTETGRPSAIDPGRPAVAGGPERLVDPDSSGLISL